MENANYSLNNCEKCFTIPNGNFKLKCDCCSSKAKLLLWQSVFCFRFVSHIFHILKFHCNSPNTWLVFADKPLFSNLLVTKVILKRYLVLHCNPHPTTNTTTHTTTTTTHTHTHKENRLSRRGTKGETGRSEHETELPPILMQASAILVIINERYKL